MKEICDSLMVLQFDDYGLRNLQAKILARVLLVIYSQEHHRLELMSELVDELSEKISDGEFNEVDAGLRTLIYLIEKIEDE